jgi:hypothetical protein
MHLMFITTDAAAPDPSAQPAARRTGRAGLGHRELRHARRGHLLDQPGHRSGHRRALAGAHPGFSGERGCPSRGLTPGTRAATATIARSRWRWARPVPSQPARPAQRQYVEA